MNVVIGPNGSGKSNLLGVLDLLACSAAGRLGHYVQQEGGIEPLLWDGRADSIRIVVTASPLPPYADVKSDSLTYDLSLVRLKKTSAYRIEAEVLENRCETKRRKAAEAFVLFKRDPASRDHLRHESASHGRSSGRCS